jgi:hypothetical protein
MPSYRFYFMHRDHSIALAANHDCSGDDEARRYAIDLLEEWPVAAAIEIWEPHDAGIEVWGVGRLVARCKRGAG